MSNLENVIQNHLCVLVGSNGRGTGGGFLGTLLVGDVFFLFFLLPLSGLTCINEQRVFF